MTSVSELVERVRSVMLEHFDVPSLGAVDWNEVVRELTAALAAGDDR